MLAHTLPQPLPAYCGARALQLSKRGLGMGGRIAVLLVPPAPAPLPPVPPLPPSPPLAGPSSASSEQLAPSARAVPRTSSGSQGVSERRDDRVMGTSWPYGMRRSSACAPLGLL